MELKTFLILAFSFAFLTLGSCGNIAYAATSVSIKTTGNSSSVNISSSSGDVPEVDGEYDDPKDKMVRVRVFAHGRRSHNSQITNVCSDADATRLVDDERWRLPSNVAYNLNVSSIPGSVDSGNFASSIAPASFSTWQGAISNKVNFSRGSDTSTSSSSYDGQNIVAFGKTSSSTLGVTYIRYLRSSRQVVDVDTILNQNLAWNVMNACVNNSTNYDVQNILTHELGHWMGLDDEYTSRYVNHTMYGYGFRGETRKSTLTTGDINAVRAIYP